MANFRLTKILAGGFGMINNEENKTSDLKKIPGVGANMEQHLKNIGIHCISDLRGKDPEELYRLDCMKKGFQEDRCKHDFGEALMKRT